jgi:hypothetical protein
MIPTSNDTAVLNRRTIEADRPLRKKSRFHLFLFAFIATMVATSLTLVLAELTIRFIAPQALVSDIVAPDPDVDYRLRPNATGRMTSPEYSAKIKINSLGFRGEEISLTKKPGVRRVLFSGDSFTFGHAVGEHETLPYLVGEELNRSHPGTFEVINGGVYGYSTANELELFIKYGLPLKPDIVVILVMIHDVSDNSNWYELTDDGLLKRKQTTSQYIESRRVTRYIPGAAWLREHSHLFKFVGVRVLPVLKSGIRQNPKHDSVPAQQGVNIDEFSPEFYEQRGGPFEITTAILATLANAAKENGALPVMLTLGGMDDFENGKVKPNRMLPHEKLIQVARKARFADAIALTPILARYTGKASLFFPQDRHWTAAATRFVAPAVAGAIVRVMSQAPKAN